MKLKLKADLIYVLIIFIISLLLLNQLFRIGVYTSHDGEAHIARLAQTSNAIHDGQFPVRWLPNWNFGFGYPTFVYVYSLPYYIGSIFRIFSLSYEQIFKVLMLLSLSFSGLTFYCFMRTQFSKLTSFVGAIFYITAPYRFADIYERGALGESLVFILLPLLFLSTKFIRRNLRKGFIVTSLVIFAAITTHALTFIIFLPVSVIYSIFTFRKDLKCYVAFLSAIVFGFILASFQWIPMIFEQKYADLDNTYYNIYLGHFISYNQLLRIPKEGINLGTGIQLGTVQILIILISVILIIKKLILSEQIRAVAVYFFLVTLISAYLTTDLSKFIWDSINSLHTLLFPWRFIAVSIFSSAFLGAYITDQAVKKIFIIAIVLVIAAIFPSRHFLKAATWYSQTDDFYLNYQDKQKLDSYFLPKGLSENYDQINIPRVSILTGSGQIKDSKLKSNNVEAEIAVYKESRVIFRVLDFPGWEFKVDGKKAQINSKEPGYEGIITAQVPTGEHLLSLKFRETPIRQFSNILTFVSFAALLVIAIYGRFKQISRKVKQLL